MKIKIYLVSLLLMGLFFNVSGQEIKGEINSGGNAVSYANIIIEGSNLGVSADENGIYRIVNSLLGSQCIIVSAIGMIEKRVNVDIEKGINIINVELEKSVYN